MIKFLTKVMYFLMAIQIVVIAGLFMLYFTTAIMKVQ